MTFRDDHDAALARAEALERELEVERERSAARERELAAERARSRRLQDQLRGSDPPIRFTIDRGDRTMIYLFAAMVLLFGLVVLVGRMAP